MNHTTNPQDDLFVPPAAEGLPIAALDSATVGADRLDVRALTPTGRNFLAHALVQLARDGWLRAEPGEGFEPVRDRETPEPAVSPSAVVSADRATLRDRIRRAVCEAEGFGFAWGTDMLEPDEYGEVADAVLAVLPAPAPVCICGHAKQQHFEDVCITEITGCDCGDYLEPQDAADVIDRWRQEALQARAADRATLLREAAVIAESLRQFEPASGARWSAQVSENVGILRVVDELRRLANEAEFAATPCSPVVPCEDGGEPCDIHERLLGHYDDSHELCPPNCQTADGPSRVAAEEQPAETQEARLVELLVHYRVQLRDNDTVDWKPSHPSLDYEDREDAEESAAMGREYFPGREYRVVTRTTTITEQP